MLSLFPGEAVVTYSDGGIVTLTTHRICKQEKEWGRSYNQDIMLEHITSCEDRTSSSVALLMIAILAFGLAVLAGVNRSRDFGIYFIAGIVLLLVYFLTRKKQITIASPSTKMHINVSGMSTENIAAFVDKVQQTKNTRIVELNKRA